MTRAALLALSHDDLIDLILAQHARIEAQAGQITALTARVTELEARPRLFNALGWPDLSPPSNTSFAK